MKRGEPYTITCAYCGDTVTREFDPRRPNLYCSRRCGTRAVGVRRRAQAEARLWSQVDVGEPHECWNWTGPLTTTGYGQFHRPGCTSTLSSSRAVWLLTVGELSATQFVCHTCDNPLCCNPAHLWIGSAADNKHDCMAKGRHVFGERSGSAKLTDGQVRELRALAASGVSRTQLMARFGVSRTLVRMIIDGKIWRHLLTQESAA